MDLEKIPQELRPHPNFVLWREETRNGKLTKIPVNAHTGENAAVDRPETWATFAIALAALTQNGTGLKGMGFVLTKSGPYTVIDLDHCRDPETGIIEPWAQKVIDRLVSYTEISPSGTGVHIWVKGKLPSGRRRKGNFEAYDSDRYLTLTGNLLEGSPLTIEVCQGQLEALHGEIFGKPNEPKAAPPKPTEEVPDGCGLSDDELIDRIRKSKSGKKFDHFMSVTDLEDLLFRYSFPSASEADFSLCTMLAFWTRKDAAQMDRIFRQSGLYRDKWDEVRGGQTYGEWTIARAIAGTKEVWRGGGKRRKKNTAQARSSEPGGETAAGQVVPKIIITRRFLNDKSDEAIGVLESANNPPFLFRRSGTLARISLDEKDHPRIIALTDIQLRGILARHAHFLKETEQGLVAAAPPLDLVKDILALGEWPSFPALEGIIQAPAIRPDGTVLSEAGYDPETGLYYVNPPNLCVPPIPESPTPEDVQRSIAYLKEIIQDFPFVEEADHANALGLLITLPLRPAIPGNIPMAAITKPTPGTGATLFVDTVAMIGTGSSAPMAGLPRDDDEMRKFITSRLLAGDPLISFDNLELPLWGPSLSRALTCTVWEDRILGGNTTARLPQRAVWVANGNNLKLRGDLPRRTFPIQLDARLAKPWEREHFNHKKLGEWTLLHRGDLLAAILTIARAWFMAGKPEPKKLLPVMGGFTGWTQIIGGILSFSGVDGFLENLKQFHEEADLEGPEWEGFLSVWVEVIGESAKSCKEVEAILKANPGFASTLPDNLQDVLKDPDKTFAKSLGRALARKEKRPFGKKNLALQGDRATRDGVILWKVAPL